MILYFKNKQKQIIKHGKTVQVYKYTKVKSFIFQEITTYSARQVFYQSFYKFKLLTFKS